MEKNLRTRLSRKKNLNYTFFSNSHIRQFSSFPEQIFLAAALRSKKGRREGVATRSPLQFPSPSSPPSLCVFVPCLSPRPEGDG